MFYTSTITNPEEGLDAILEAAERFNTDRFLYAVQYKNYDESQLDSMAKEIACYRNKLEKEYERLQDFAKTFNESFVTDDNKCYDVALKALNKIKSGVSETKRIYMKFCPRGRQDKFHSIYGNKKVSAFTYSTLSSEEIQLDAFGLEEFPVAIQGLYREMEKFFTLLVRCVQLCKQVIRDERTIRKNGNYCQYLYERFKEKFLKKIAHVLQLIPRNSEQLTAENNPAIAARRNYGSAEAFAQHAFHNYPTGVMEPYMLKETFDEERMGDMTKMEILLFRGNLEQTRTVRLLIAHFDDLMPADWKRKKLSGYHVQMFMRWCGIQAGQEKHFVEYFMQEYQRVKAHKYGTITSAAVSGHKEKVLRNDNEYREFAQKIQEMLSSHISMRKAVGFE